MMRFFKPILPSVLALPLVSGAVYAQAPAGPPCAERSMATRQLHELYGERRVGPLPANASLVFEVQLLGIEPR